MVDKGSYSTDEIDAIYSLGKMYLETGHFEQAQAIFEGLTHVAHNLESSFLGLAVVYICQGKYDSAIFAGREAVRLNPNSIRGRLVLAQAYLCVEDFGLAGTFLGEVGDKLTLEGCSEEDDLNKFFKLLVSCYHHRRDLLLKK